MNVVKMNGTYNCTDKDVLAMRAHSVFALLLCRYMTDAEKCNAARGVTNEAIYTRADMLRYVAKHSVKVSMVAPRAAKAA